MSSFSDEELASMHPIEIGDHPYACVLELARCRRLARILIERIESEFTDENGVDALSFQEAAGAQLALDHVRHIFAIPEEE